MQDILIIGYGDIGKRVACLSMEHGGDVSALIRNTQRAGELQDIHIHPLTGDLDNPETLTKLRVKRALVYYFAPPPSDGSDDPRMTNFIDCLTEDNLPSKIVYISTTGVYGDCHGEWVTEQTPVNPQTQRGRRRLAAEKLLEKWHERTGIPVVILRVAGIYGPGRLPIERIKSGQPVLNEKDTPFSNRIHSDDLARICLEAAQYATPGYHVYNVSDGHPTTMTDYFNHVAKHAGLAPPRVVSIDEANGQFSPMMLSFLNESKRVDNRKMLKELGIQLLYPDLETGLKHCQSNH